MKAWSILLCIDNSACCWCNGVGNIFVAHFGPRHLNATVYLSIVTDHVYLFSVLPAGYGTMSESSKQRN